MAALVLFFFFISSCCLFSALLFNPDPQVLKLLQMDLFNSMEIGFSVSAVVFGETVPSVAAVFEKSSGGEV